MPMSGRLTEPLWRVATGLGEAELTCRCARHRHRRAPQTELEHQAAVEDRRDARVITRDDHTENRAVLGQDAVLIAVVRGDDRHRHGLGSRLRNRTAAAETGLGGDRPSRHHLTELVSVSALDVLQQVEHVGRGRTEDSAPSANVLLAQVLTQTRLIQPAISRDPPEITCQGSRLHIPDEQVYGKRGVDALPQVGGGGCQQLQRAQA